jgi:chlorite dismutase
MFRFDWKGWRALPPQDQIRVLDEATQLFESFEKGEGGAHPNQSAAFSQLGHKGDLLLVHFRDTIEDLNKAELRIRRLGLAAFLEPTSSYLSVAELGLYESSVKTYASLAERGIVPHTPEWVTEVKGVLARQTAAMAPRLFPSIPDAKYLCFYPMDKKRGEKDNWYTQSMTDRQRMMQDHGAIGRRYAGEVRQIITGSIGFDDWEWGVDLFADDPLVFKRLIYEMRFDEASALYAVFGPFYVGVRLPAGRLSAWTQGLE